MKWLGVLVAIVTALAVVLYLDAGVWDRFRHGTGEVAGIVAEQRQQVDDNDDDDFFPSRLAVVDGYLGLRLTPETQHISGLRTLEPRPWEYRHEIRTVAEVRNIGPLLEFRARFKQHESEIALARIAVKHARETYDRLSLLYADGGNISEREVQEAESKLRSSEARLELHLQTIQALRAQAVQSWGDKMAAELLSDNSEIFRKFRTREEALLFVSLQRHEHLLHEPDVIFVGHDGNRMAAREARLLSAAVETDPLLQGESYYYTTAAENLRVGMRLNAWLPATADTVDGVLIPLEAVVWQAGSPWVYIRHGGDFFYRIALPDAIKLGRDWFVPADAIPRDSSIVVNGAQMLLSEEFRWQIPDEDDDP